MKKSYRALAGILLAFCVLLSTGCNREQKKADADSPEWRNNGKTIQWRYGSEDEWHDLIDLDQLKGADGENGADGVDGKDGQNGVDGKDGKNGKDGQNGIDGKDGKDGQNGIDGKDGAPGADGKDGVCSGYFFARGSTGRAILNKVDKLSLDFAPVFSQGDLVSWDNNSKAITLKAGHTYSVCLSGSFRISPNNNDSIAQISLSSGYDLWCEKSIHTKINGDGNQIEIQVPVIYDRLYTVSEETGDITLQYSVQQVDYNTILELSSYTITIIVLD